MIDLRSIKLQSINLGGVDLSGIRLGYHKEGQAGEPVPDVENAIMLVDGGLQDLVTTAAEKQISFATE